MQVLLVLGGGSSWFRGSLDIQSGVDRLVLVQGPSTFVKIATYGFALLLVIGVWLCYRTLFTTQTTTFTCDRASGKCELDGDSRNLPALADIASAELDTSHENRQGDFRWVTLVKKDGTKKNISPQGAQLESVVAEYKASVEAIQKFLADPSAPKLETKFTYRASLAEKVYIVMTFAGGLLVMGALLILWNTRTFTFDKSSGKATLVDSRPLFGGNERDVAFDKITSIASGTSVELVLADNSKVAVASGDDIASIADKLHELTGKPINAR